MHRAMRPHTIETTGRAYNGLDDSQDGLETRFDVDILLLDGLLLPHHQLEVVVRLLVLELLDAAVQPLDLVLCSLSDGSLGLAVVCALPRKLLRGEVGYAARRGCAGTTSLCSLLLLTGGALWRRVCTSGSLARR